MEITELKTSDLCELCKHCRKLSLPDNENETENENDSGNRLRIGLQFRDIGLRTTSFSDCESVCSSEISDATKSLEDSEEYAEEYSTGNKEIRLIGDAYHENQTELLFRSSVNTYRNVTINKSKNVHLGNITYINGPVYVNQTANIINNQTIINNYSNNDGIRPPRIISRRNWLAEPPRSPYEEMEKPAKFVVIAHSATEDATTEPDNVLLVRLIQQFHVESRKWDDIGYNFLIGCDGIAFVGCFINKTPPKAALANAKQLIAYGVKIGAI
ncbi:hypothetical protein QE152_g22675 [Popillia japonica]|uniref:Peptidoglycan recognition protein family domain-containing protein n=1 Tax=Popillia japonica TaxID=7064 RepID=A0AAW1KJE2_POPJA